MAEEYGKWISVKDELPEKSYVLVFAPHYGCTAAECVTVSYYSSRREWSLERDCGADGKVTDWMPLPSPPKH